MKRRSILACFLLSLVFPVYAQLLPYKNPSLPIQERVADLLQRMTPEEKFWQLFMIPGDLGADSTRFRHGIFGFQVNTVQLQQGAATQLMHYSAAQTAQQTLDKINSIQRYFVEHTRLGIPIIAFDEALHGLVRSEATAFPQSIALAASWDTVLMRRVASAIANETKSRGIRHILSPVLNLATDPRWGRTEETYGEDPILSAAMGVAFIRSFEQKGIMTNPKHFAVNHGDGGRDSYPIHFSERFLEETYFVPFKAAIQQGGASSIMSAYNSIDGSPSSANNWLLNEKLRKDWGFTGFVLSDAGATGGANVLHFTAADYAEAGKRSVENGQDVMFQTAYEHHALFNKYFLDGTINGVAVDSAVARVLRAKFLLGLFEKPYLNASDVEVWTVGDHRKLAREAAAKSFVLLKNAAGKGSAVPALPLRGSTQSIALIGVDAAEARLGGYSGPGIRNVSILEAMRKRTGSKLVRYAPGPGRIYKDWQIVPSSALSSSKDGRSVAGLQGEYFNNITLEGKPVVQRTDAQIAFQWTLFSPDAEKLNYDFFSARWTGKIKSQETGNFQIGIDGNDGYRLWLNGKLLIDNWIKQSHHTRMASVYFEKGKQYDIRIEYMEPSGNAWFRLVWNQGLKDSSAVKIREAVQLAAQSDVAIVVAGIEEGEFRDRASLALPGRQEQLIKAVAATGKPVVVLLTGGSAITMKGWIDDVHAVAMIWYPGEAGGEAVADLIWGDLNPSGKLPLTFPLSEAQLPLVYNHKPTGRGDDYNNLTGMPMFPFGFGLSYTQFKYSDLRLSTKKISVGDSLRLRFTVSNAGNLAGDEVVQLYLHDELASVAQPVKALKAFQRVHLKPGESRQLEFTIRPDMLMMWNLQLQQVIEPGAFRLMIGSSSADIRLREIFVVE